MTFSGSSIRGEEARSEGFTDRQWELVSRVKLTEGMIAGIIHETSFRLYFDVDLSAAATGSIEQVEVVTS